MDIILFLSFYRKKYLCLGVTLPLESSTIGLNFWYQIKCSLHNAATVCSKCYKTGTNSVLQKWENSLLDKMLFEFGFEGQVRFFLF